MRTGDVLVRQKYLPQRARKPNGVPDSRAHDEGPRRPARLSRCHTGDIEVSAEMFGLAVFEYPGLRKAESRRCPIEGQIRYRHVDFPRLPDVIVIAEEINIRISTLEKMEKGAWNALANRVVPFHELDSQPRGQCTNHVARVIR